MHLQQALATTAGIYNSYPTVPNLRTVRAVRKSERSETTGEVKENRNIIPLPLRLRYALYKSNSYIFSIIYFLYMFTIQERVDKPQEL